MSISFKGIGSSEEEEYTDEFHVQPEEGTGFSPTDKAQVHTFRKIFGLTSCLLSALPNLAKSKCGSCKEKVDSL